jgi:hemoglobin
MRPTLYEFAGGAEAFPPFAAALHARCLADPELNHPFSHADQNPEHVERLAAYLAEALGGPPAYSAEYGGDQTALVLLHAGNGDMSDLGRRFADCFMGAADDAGWPDDPPFRAAIRGYIERSVDEVALSHPLDTDVPAGLPIPRWSWDGPSELTSRKSQSGSSRTDAWSPWHRPRLTSYGGQRLRGAETRRPGGDPRASCSVEGIAAACWASSRSVGGVIRPKPHTLTLEARAASTEVARGTRDADPNASP